MGVGDGLARRRQLEPPGIQNSHPVVHAETLVEVDALVAVISTSRDMWTTKHLGEYRVHTVKHIKHRGVGENSAHESIAPSFLAEMHTCLGLAVHMYTCVENENQQRRARKQLL